MTRKKRQEASQRMKQIWAKRKAKAAIPLGKPIAAMEFGAGKPNLPDVNATVEVSDKDEIMVLASIVGLMGKLSTAGKQYIAYRFG